jgi:hypothetical protein
MQPAIVSRADRQAVTQAWGEWIAGMGRWDLFGGLTYDQRRRAPRSPGPQRSSQVWGGGQRLRYGPGRLGAEVAWQHVNSWLEYAPKRLGRPVEAAVVALEYQRNGWPHFHPLLRLAGGLQPHDIERLGSLWVERHGYNRLEPPRNRQDVCAYAAKYLSKDLGRGDILFWPPAGQVALPEPVQ